MLLGTLDTSLLGNLFKCKEIKPEIPEWWSIRPHEEIITGDQGF